jgi:hypothetical protein
VGEFGTILHYDGTTWTQQANVPTPQSLNGIWGNGPADIFVVGDFGTILHFDGAAWTPQPSGTTEHLVGVYGGSGSDVYAVGFNGTVLHYDGSAWQPEAVGLTSHKLFSVTVICDKVVAVGDAGTMIAKETPCADTISEDDFESSNLLGWCSTESDEGDLSLSPAAALEGTQGLAALIDDTASVFVRDCKPLNEPRYRARFLFDPNGVDPGESSSHRRLRLFLGMDQAAGKRVVTLVLRRLAGSYSVRARVLRDDGTRANTPFVPISDGPHSIQFDWRRADAPGANNGSFELWIDNVSVAVLQNLDNDTRYIDATRLGALSVKGGAGGTMYFDAFASRRRTYIP